MIDVPDNHEGQVVRDVVICMVPTRKSYPFKRGQYSRMVSTFSIRRDSMRPPVSLR